MLRVAHFFVISTSHTLFICAFFRVFNIPFLAMHFCLCQLLHASTETVFDVKFPFIFTLDELHKRLRYRENRISLESPLKDLYAG